MEEINRRTDIDRKNESLKYYKSITQKSKEKEQARIESENLKMLNRIENTKSLFDRKQLEKDYNKSRIYGEKLQEFPTTK